MTWPLTDEEAAERRAHIASCGGACDQGRKPCAAPDACRLPLRDDEDADQHEGFGAIAVPILGFGAILLLALGVHLILKAMT